MCFSVDTSKVVSVLKCTGINHLLQNYLNHQQKFRSSVHTIRTGGFTVHFRICFIEIIKIKVLRLGIVTFSYLEIPI